jgi:lipopolysaccharide export system permease protein
MISFLVTLGVFTFIMYVGTFIKSIDLISSGVPGKILMQIFSYEIPFILTFAIPMSVLTTTLLQFGRLSIDGEITAMRACGLNIRQIITPILLLSVLITAFCVYINWDLGPKGHYARRKALVDVKKIDPVKLLEEGRFVKGFPGLEIFVGHKKGSEVRDVVVRELKDGVRIRTIRAKEGTIAFDKEAVMMNIELRRVHITQYDPEAPYDLLKARDFPTDKYTKSRSYEELMSSRSVRKKHKDKSFKELMFTIKYVEEAYPVLFEEREYERLRFKRTEAMVEASKRIGLSISCFSFTLLAIPLGMKSKRKESSVGIGISLAIVFGFYFFIIIAEALTKSAHLFPELIIWIPIVISQFAAFFMLKRIV